MKITCRRLLSVIVGEDVSVTILGVDSSDEPSPIGRGWGKGNESASREWGREKSPCTPSEVVTSESPCDE